MRGWEAAEGERQCDKDAKGRQGTMGRWGAVPVNSPQETLILPEGNVRLASCKHS